MTAGEYRLVAASVPVDALAPAFGERTPSRLAQVTGIVETLRSLGKL